MDIRRLPLRSSFLTTLIDYCGRKAQLEALNPQRELPHYMMGGQVMSLIMENFLAGRLQDEDPDMVSARAFLSVARAGVYAYSEEQKYLIVRRASELFDHTRRWWMNSGLNVIAAEIEVRSQTEAGTDIAIKPDFLAELDGKIILGDGKAMACFGKSISPPFFTEQDLRQSIQLSMYTYVLERGGVAYLNVPEGARNMTNKEMADNFTSVPIQFNIDKIGLLQFGACVPRKVTTKSGEKGDLKGPPLQLMDYDPACAEYARESINFAEMCITFGQYPRVARRVQGKSSCSGCAFQQTCWSNHVDPTGPIADFLLEK